MSETVLRVLLYSLVPLLFAGGVCVLDRATRSRERRIETALILMLAIGVAGSGLTGFLAHFFLSDVVARSIGWETGSPFQREVAFANLVLGVLGLVATGRRDGFREATVVAVAVFGGGATVVHLQDIAATGNLAPGNTVQNFANLMRPALLVWLLLALRRIEATPASEAGSAAFAAWREPLLPASGAVTAVVATAYGVGFALDRTWSVSLAGIALGFALLLLALARSPAHRLRGL